MEGVVGLAGVGLAVPGVIDVIIRGGIVVYDKIETFRNMDKAMISFRDTTLNLKQGELYFGLKALETASRDRMVPNAIITRLEAVLREIEENLAISDRSLDNVKQDNLTGKLVYTLWHGKGSQRQLHKQAESLKNSCDELKSFCLQLHNFRAESSSYLLTSDTFKLLHETTDNHPGEQLPNSDIVVACGNYAAKGKRVNADFVLERKLRENDVRYLCSKLNKEDLAGREGVLPALGYRQPPYNDPDGTKFSQFVIELPKDTERKSLAQCINTEPRPTLPERLDLCLKLANAVKTVHDLGLVHKALRPRAILIISGSIYLQDWTYIRELSGATTQLGETNWMKAIYQHPERQGKSVDAAYDSFHDIYSLGVCMLEVLLWSPFLVTEKEGGTTPDNICELFESFGLRRGDVVDGLPARYKGDPVKMAGRPWATKAIWCDIAREKLNDSEVRRLVLQCIDGGFESATDVIICIEALLRSQESLAR